MRNYLTILLCCLVVASYSQKKDPWAGTAKRTTQQMKGNLDLSPAQEKSVYDATYEFHKKAPMIAKDKTLKVSAREKYVRQVNKVLDDVQRKKWLKMRATDEIKDYDEK